MEVEDLPLDRISNLPPNVIQIILTRMPMRDAFRTSVLSQSWRYHYLNIPTLWCGYGLFENTATKRLSMKCKLLHVIYPILLRHKGPILEFFLSHLDLKSCFEIDLIILHLSRNPTLKKFTLLFESRDEYKLPPAFFKLQQLTHLSLQGGVFQPPVSFTGFNNLVSIYFDSVSMTAEGFLRLISKCPLLKNFTLIGYEEHFMGSWNDGIVEFFECLPLVENLCMNWYPIKFFAKGVIPPKLPTTLANVNYLGLHGLSNPTNVDLRFVLLLVTSSPNVEKIVIRMENNPVEATSPPVMNHVNQEDYSCVMLDHLLEIHIYNLSNMKTEMDFIKLILAKSPMLKNLYIYIDEIVDIYDEVEMLKELIQYQRASTRVKITIK